MDETPRIVICLPLSHQAFGERLSRDLTNRGLRILLIYTPAQLQEITDFSVIGIVITASSTHTPLVHAAIEVASAAQRPILPLLLGRESDIPTSHKELLKETQWCDFSGDFATGWRELLLTLDMQGISRWPYNPAAYDANVAVARAQNGLTPPGWTIYRGYTRVTRHITRATLLSVGAVLIIALLASLYQSSIWWVYAVMGGVGILLSFHDYRNWVFEPSRQGHIIVITPRGFLSETESGADSFAFAQLKSIRMRGQYHPKKRGKIAYSTTILELEPRDGAKKDIVISNSYDLLQIRNGEPYASYVSVKIAKTIITAFQQAVQLPGVSPHVQKPRLFVSYAHKDELACFQMERGLHNLDFEPWVDRSRLRSGTQWANEIDAAIQQCAALVLLISPDAMKSDYIQIEIESALKWKKPIIGIVVRKGDHIRKDWQPYVCAEMRGPTLREFVPVLYALDRKGILSDEMRTMRQAYPAFVVARAMSGASLPDERVFVSSRMSYLRHFSMWFISIFFVVASLIIPQFLFILCIYAMYITTELINGTFQGKRDMIVLHPTGIATYRKGSLGKLEYNRSDNWRIMRSSWVSGTVCQLQEKRFYEVSTRFHNHRQIARAIVDAFWQWRSQM